MEVSDFSSLFKVPNIFRDVIYAVFGIAFLVIINLNGGLSESLKLDQFNNWERDFIYLLLAFILGRTLRLIGDVWMDLIRFALYSRKKNMVIEFWQKFRELPRDFEVDSKPNLILDLEMEQYIESQPALKNKIERNSYHWTFVRCFLGLFLCATVLYSSAWIGVAIFTLITISDDMDYAEERREIGILVHRARAKT